MYLVSLCARIIKTFIGFSSETCSAYFRFKNFNSITKIFFLENRISMHSWLSYGFTWLRPHTKQIFRCPDCEMENHNQPQNWWNYHKTFSCNLSKSKSGTWHIRSLFSRILESLCTYRIVSGRIASHHIVSNYEDSQPEKGWQKI